MLLYALSNFECLHVQKQQLFVDPAPGGGGSCAPLDSVTVKYVMTGVSRGAQHFRAFIIHTNLALVHLPQTLQIKFSSLSLRN